MQSLHDILHYNIWNYYLENKELTTHEDLEKYLNVKVRDLRKSLEKGKRAYENYSDCKTMTAINSESYWEWRKKVNDESEYSKILLLAFLAAKSIVGKKQYCKTNYDMLLSRMAGKDSPEYHTASNGKNKGKRILRLPEHLKPYNTRRKLERLRDDLTRFHVSWWSDPGVRGFYLSNTKVSRKQLYKLIHKPSKSIDEKRRESKERVRKEVEMIINRHTDNLNDIPN